MDFNRYIRFFDNSQSPLIYGEDWGVYQFPDGQNQIWFSKDSQVRSLRVCMNTATILDLVAQSAWAVGSLDIFVTYLYGARSDKSLSGERRVPNVAQYARSILAGASSTLDILVPHDSNENGTALALIPDMSQYDGIVYPDESARGRQPWLHNSGLPEYIFDKERDQETGKIIGLICPADVRGNRLLVADDICDGGATFIKVAGLLPPSQLDLCVAHGIFSGGALDRLTAAGYDQIYTTNSFVQSKLEDEVQIQSRCVVTDVWNP